VLTLSCPNDNHHNNHGDTPDGENRSGSEGVNEPDTGKDPGPVIPDDIGSFGWGVGFGGGVGEGGSDHGDNDSSARGGSLWRRWGRKQ
jgi:hypothetical protein